jgi:hypothetical protein
MGPPHALKLGGPCQPLPIALPTKPTEAVADGIRTKAPRLREAGAAFCLGRPTRVRPVPLPYISNFDELNERSEAAINETKRLLDECLAWQESLQRRLGMMWLRARFYPESVKGYALSNLPAITLSSLRVPSRGGF